MVGRWWGQGERCKEQTMWPWWVWIKRSVFISSWIWPLACFKLDIYIQFLYIYIYIIFILGRCKSCCHLSTDAGRKETLKQRDKSRYTGHPGKLGQWPDTVGGNRDVISRQMEMCLGEESKVQVRIIGYVDKRGGRYWWRWMQPQKQESGWVRKGSGHRIQRPLAAWSRRYV